MRLNNCNHANCIIILVSLNCYFSCFHRLLEQIVSRNSEESNFLQISRSRCLTLSHFPLYFVYSSPSPTFFYYRLILLAGKTIRNYKLIRLEERLAKGQDCRRVSSRTYLKAIRRLFGLNGLSRTCYRDGERYFLLDQLIVCQVIVKKLTCIFKSEINK
jgi:hypothetical protein